MSAAAAHSSTILRLARPLISGNLATAGMMTADTLRCFDDATRPMAMSVLSYRLLALPLARWLGVGLGQGAPGVWTGLITGVFARTLLLSVRYRHITRDRSPS
jgi:MATE family multidrug resistance protein